MHSKTKWMAGGCRRKNRCRLWASARQITRSVIGEGGLKCSVEENCFENDNLLKRKVVGAWYLSEHFMH